MASTPAIAAASNRKPGNKRTNHDGDNDTDSGNLATKTPVKTPGRFHGAADPPSTSRRSVHTPLDRTAPRDLLNSVRRGVASASGGARRNNVPTPHTQAARRALFQRRTAVFTPGRNRRRSLRDQRETPMDVLRNLGRALAASSKPIRYSSSPQDKPSSIAPIREMDDDDDELPLERPRLSLALDEDDDDDLQPPRSSGLEEENYTVRSVELPRRATTDQLPPLALSRASLGSVGASDSFNDNDPPQDTGRPSDFFPGLLEDLRAQADARADFAYERVDEDDAPQPVLARESDFGIQMPEGVGDQTTFVLSEPGADAAKTSPLQVQEFFDDAVLDEPADPYLDVAGGTVDDIDTSEGWQVATAQDDADATGSNPFRAERSSGPRSMRRRISRHGIEYPPLPPAFVKRVAQTALQSSGLRNHRISADVLDSLTQASEWYFEQLGDDLGAYAAHAKRKTIDESDVVTLMLRQRQIGSTATMFSLAQKHLPRELLQELRMPAPKPKMRRKEQAMKMQKPAEDHQTLRT